MKQTHRRDVVVAEKGLAGMPTPLIRAMLNLCPREPGATCSFEVAGRPPVVLTFESRRRAEAELKRRKA